ncbi:MAG: DNA-deoxyinosine glycosylase [Gammaproteobacteria bacterium]
MTADRPLTGFPPVAAKNARVLILGSMPGTASLQATQYYAHPRNQFWPIMAELLGFSLTAAYAERTAALQVAGIAVWDVIRACTRVGSLDADIDDASLQANNFVSFFRQHDKIEHVYFNGGKAEATYRRHVSPWLDNLTMQYTRLPSTSPANAGMTYQQKLAAWQVLLDSI